MLKGVSLHLYLIIYFLNSLFEQFVLIKNELLFLINSQ